jgi:hypothetical protein
VKHPHRTMTRIVLSTLPLLLAVFGLGLPRVLAEDDPTTITAPAILINEVKSGGSNTTPSEYVTLYNQSDTPVSLSEWRIEYAKATFPAASCSATNWKVANSSAATSISLTDTIDAHSVSKVYTIAINNDAAGTIRILDTSKNIIDLLGWGTTTSPAVCTKSAQAPMLTTNNSLTRYLTCDSSVPIDTGINANDFTLNSLPVAGNLGTIKAPQCAPPVTPITPSTPSGTDEEPVVTNGACQNVTISELLPNPAGTDSGHEFIELHNTTSAVNNLSGCSLQTSASSTKSFDLGTITLAANEYYSLSDTDSGLTLSNASGGTVWLLDSTQEIQAVSYPADMEDDTVWTIADGQWGLSYTPTPAAANILTTTKPCPEGQIRNSETNRCVTITTEDADSPTPCDTGQERNPETNRCRAIATATSTAQTACKAGQERNPETNRCRNITTATTDKACPAGQERNAETNRCRKISATTSSKSGGGAGDITDVASSELQHSKPYWLIAGAVLVAAIGYAVYEWRQELKLLWASSLQSLTKTKATKIG